MLVSRVGSIAIVNVDSVASSQAQRYTQIGALPEGMVPIEVPGMIAAFYAPLAYRGALTNGESGYIYVTTTGTINIWTSTAEPFYLGQLVVPLASW